MPDIIRNIDQTISVRGSTVGYRSLPSYYMPMHNHSEVQILVPLEGAHYEITWLTEDRVADSKHLATADICLIPPLLEHEVRWSNSANFINLKITPNFIQEHLADEFSVDEQIFNAYIGFEDPFLFHLGRSLRAHFLQGGHTNYNYLDALLSVVTQHILDNCVMRMSTPVPENEAVQVPCEKIRDAIVIISNNLDRNLSIEEIADKVGMSHYHFMRVFKENVGMPAARFHTMQRIEKAKELLLKNERIIDVAHALGFSSQSHFSNVFARSVGTTPRKFRQQRENQAL